MLVVSRALPACLWCLRSPPLVAARLLDSSQTIKTLACTAFSPCAVSVQQVVVEWKQRNLSIINDGSQRNFLQDQSQGGADFRTFGISQIF